MGRKKSENTETVLAVYSTKDADSASLALLKADIECTRRKIGVGKYGNFLMALNNYGEEICVSPSDAAQASRILEDWKLQRRKKQETAPMEKIENSDSCRKNSMNEALSARILAAIALAAAVAFYLIQRY